MSGRIVIDVSSADMSGPTLADLIGRDCRIIYKNGEMRCGRITRIDASGFFTSVNNCEIYYYFRDLRRIESL